jgi:hypothetical protein
MVIEKDLLGAARDALSFHNNLTILEKRMYSSSKPLFF